MDHKSISAALPGCTTRTMFVRGIAGGLVVPQYVSRVEIARPGGGTYGWQVRYRTPSAFFADRDYGRADSPAPSARAALDEAIAYLAGVWAGPRVRSVRAEAPTKKWPVGKAGVQLHWHQLRNGGQSCAVHVNGARRRLATLYVGSGSEVTNERLAAVIDQAIAIRERFEAERRNPSRPVAKVR